MSGLNLLSHPSPSSDTRRRVAPESYPQPQDPHRPRQSIRLEGPPRPYDPNASKLLPAQSAPHLTHNLFDRDRGSGSRLDITSQRRDGGGSTSSNSQSLFGSGNSRERVTLNPDGRSSGSLRDGQTPISSKEVISHSTSSKRGTSLLDAPTGPGNRKSLLDTPPKIQRRESAPDSSKMAVPDFFNMSSGGGGRRWGSVSPQDGSPQISKISLNQPDPPYGSGRFLRASQSSLEGRSPNHSTTAFREVEQTSPTSPDPTPTLPNQPDQTTPPLPNPHLLPTQKSETSSLDSDPFATHSPRTGIISPTFSSERLDELHALQPLPHRFLNPLAHKSPQMYMNAEDFDILATRLDQISIFSNESLDMPEGLTPLSGTGGESKKLEG
ncbi:hypothetical protein HK097_003159, partial [Rhizophlyctis rosea]